MWPDWMVWLVSGLKGFFDLFRTRAVYGIPLDLLVRFVVLGATYWILRGRTTLQWTLAVCLTILLGKEIFDAFAVRSWSRIHWPEFLDLQDVLSGCLGMLSAEAGRRALGLPPHPSLDPTSVEDEDE